MWQMCLCQARKHDILRAANMDQSACGFQGSNVLRCFEQWIAATKSTAAPVLCCYCCSSPTHRRVACRIDDQWNANSFVVPSYRLLATNQNAETNYRYSRLSAKGSSPGCHFGKNPQKGHADQVQDSMLAQFIHTGCSRCRESRQTDPVPSAWTGA